MRDPSPQNGLGSRPIRPLVCRVRCLVSRLASDEDRNTTHPKTPPVPLAYGLRPSSLHSSIPSSQGLRAAALVPRALKSPLFNSQLPRSPCCCLGAAAPRPARWPPAGGRPTCSRSRSCCCSSRSRRRPRRRPSPRRGPVRARSAAPARPRCSRSST